MAITILTTATRTFVAAVAVQLFGAVAVCSAQATLDVGIAGGMSRQSSGPSSLGGIVFADWHLSPAFSVGPELAAAADVSGQQQLRSDAAIANLRSRHHDAIVSALAKYRITGLSYFEAAVVGGGGTAVRSTVLQGTSQSLLSPRVSTAVDDRRTKVVGAGIVGLDGTFQVSPRTALVLTARWYLLSDNDRTANEGTMMFTFGGGGRVSF